jgi:hypothetical protein
MESILALWSLERYDIVVQKSIQGFAYWAWWLAAAGDDWLTEIHSQCTPTVNARWFYTKITEFQDLITPRIIVQLI